jgi:condensin complex subunit 1
LIARFVPDKHSLGHDLLTPQAYPMRMAIVENIGHLIKYLTTSEDEKRDKKINSLFDLLIERFLDLNSYVRAKVFNVIIKLCECVRTCSVYIIV